MNKRMICVTLLAATIVSAIVFAALTKPVHVNASMAPDNSAWVENFDGETLGSRWGWVRENPAYWSLTADPGSLRLITRGSLTQAINNLENILLTPAPGMDYRIITKLTFSPTENYHRAGLVVYRDDDNYFQMTRAYTDGDSVRVKAEIGGVAAYYSAIGVTGTTLYLRIDKYGSDYYGFYSLDGNLWEFVGQTNFPLSDTSIGLLAEYGPTTAEINADFDYFQFIPRTFNHSWLDDFNGPALDGAWSWKNEDPTHWSLSANPGFLQIITQSGGMFSGMYHNLLVTQAPSDEYRITTRATISPTENFQGASIVVYGDDNNYVRVGLRFADTGDEVNFRQVSNGVIVIGTGVSETATTVYLRIIKEGDVYTGYYSTDGNSYVYMGQAVAALADPKMGIVSEGGPSTTEIPSDYAFFRLENNVNRVYLPLVKK